MVSVLVLYALSVGPVCHLVLPPGRAKASQVEVLEKFYGPLSRVISSLSLQNYATAYVDWWDAVLRAPLPAPDQAGVRPL